MATFIRHMRRTHHPSQGGRTVPWQLSLYTWQEPITLLRVVEQCHGNIHYTHDKNPSPFSGWLSSAMATFIIHVTRAHHPSQDGRAVPWQHSLYTWQEPITLLRMVEQCHGNIHYTHDKNPSPFSGWLSSAMATFIRHMTRTHHPSQGGRAVLWQLSLYTWQEPITLLRVVEQCHGNIHYTHDNNPSPFSGWSSSAMATFIIHVTRTHHPSQDGRVVPWQHSLYTWQEPITLLRVVE